MVPAAPEQDSSLRYRIVTKTIMAISGNYLRQLLLEGSNWMEGQRASPTPLSCGQKPDVAFRSNLDSRKPGLEGR